MSISYRVKITCDENVNCEYCNGCYFVAKFVRDIPSHIPRGLTKGNKLCYGLFLKTIPYVWCVCNEHMLQIKLKNICYSNKYKNDKLYPVNISDDTIIDCNEDENTHCIYEELLEKVLDVFPDMDYSLHWNCKTCLLALQRKSMICGCGCDDDHDGWSGGIEESFPQYTSWKAV